MRLDWKALGSATACSLALGYVICIAYDVAFDQHMYQAWTVALPGFHWLSWASFGIGLVEVVAYGVFFGLVFAPLYNFFLVRVWKQTA